MNYDLSVSMVIQIIIYIGVNLLFQCSIISTYLVTSVVLFIISVLHSKVVF